ncbi:MAG: hypothetical protein JSW55_11065, partial [Chloroflexota bacterium]
LLHKLDHPPHKKVGLSRRRAPSHDCGGKCDKIRKSTSNVAVDCHGRVHVAIASASKLYNRPHSITVDVVIPEEGAEGVLVTQGSRNSGYALFLKDGHLHYIHIAMDHCAEKNRVSSELAPAGGPLVGCNIKGLGVDDDCYS